MTLAGCQAGQGTSLELGVTALDAERIGYVGPCSPASDEAHSYRFRLSAMSTTFEITGGASRTELADALAGNVIDSVSLTAQHGRN